MSAAPDARVRFLREIAEELGAQSIEEVHLFQPLRRGGLESGVAVVAARVVEPLDEESLEAANEPSSNQTAEGEDAGSTPAAESPEAEVRETEEAQAGPGEGYAGGAGESAGAEAEQEGSDEAAGDGPPPHFQSTPASGDPSHHSIAGGAESFHTSRSQRPDATPRLTVYRAVYRWTRKGVDRGKWEIAITAEADAPLQAVSDVVRGVQRRAGDDSEPERLGRPELEIALSDRPWTVTATM